MPTIENTDFHVVCAVIGVFGTIFALISYLVKERLFLSESLLALIAGVVAGPYVCNFLRPDRWAGGIEELQTSTLDFTRLVLTIQVSLAGIQLPGRFSKKAWVPLTSMLTLGMVGMWGVSSFLVWAICAIDDGQGNTFRIPFLHALAIGACVAPTDPVLAVTVIKGRFADKHVRPQLAQLISAESGANDGLGYPFLYFALYFIRYVGGNGEHADSAGGASEAMKMFFGETIGFVVLLSVVWGALLGWLARRALKFCDSLSYVDRESFYAFTVLLAILLVGTCGMVGSDDILAGFVAGNALNWDDWFRDRTAQDSFDPTIDTLLNWGVFIFFGAVCPWRWFAPSIHGNWESDVGSLQLWRLVCLAIAVLCLRRLPVVLILYKCGLFKDNVRSLKEALFMGWFGPIGVSSIFYSQAAITYLREDITGPEGELRRDVRQLYYLLQVCVWFVMVSSVIIHGLSIFSWKMSNSFLYYTVIGRDIAHHKHVIHPKEAWQHEKDAIRHVYQLAKVEGAEEAEKRLLHLERQRPKPAFRRLRLDSSHSTRTD